MGGGLEAGEEEVAIAHSGKYNYGHLEGIVQVEIPDQIRSDPKLIAAVDAATSLLKEEIGNTILDVAAHWDVPGNDSDQKALDLTLTDSVVTVASRFVLSEWKNPSRLQTRLHRLWGDLLQARSAKQVEKLKEWLVTSNGE